MKTRSNSLLLALPVLLLGYGCSQKPEETTATDISPDLTEERFTELESRILELESQISRIDEKIVPPNPQIDRTPLTATTETITTEPDPTYSEIKQFIENGSFTVKDDTVYYTGDIILDFGPNLKITSVDGNLLSDIKQTVFGGDMIVQTKTGEGNVLSLHITDGFLERDGEKVKIDTSNPGTFKMKYMSNKAVLTTSEAAPPTS